MNAAASSLVAERSATWRDVERLHNENPNWGCKTIAAQLQREGLSRGNKQLDAWVRATFARRGWANPNGKTRNHKREVARGVARKASARRFNVQREAPEMMPALRDRAREREEQQAAWWLKD